MTRWIEIKCHCCNGIQWGGDSPRECLDCDGGGGLWVSEKDRIAAYPGRFLGSEPGRFAQTLASFEDPCECKRMSKPYHMNYDIDFERDKTIAKVFFNWEFTKPRHGWCCTCQRCGRHNDDCQPGEWSCDFSDDIGAAMRVVDAMHARGWDFSLFLFDKQYSVSFDPRFSSGRNLQVEGENEPARAICKAAMKALGYE